MKQHLAVSAIGSDRTGMVHDLTRLVSECGGNISESRMAGLGSEFAMLLLISGNWHALAKLETELKRLADSSGLILHLKRTEPRSARTDMLPYSIDVVCLDQTGIVSGLSGFFSSRSIDIAEGSTRSYPAAHTGAPMCSVQMIVNVPSRIHVAHLREEFMEFCDSLNLDAILEPVKSKRNGHSQNRQQGKGFLAALERRHHLVVRAGRGPQARDLLLPEGHDLRLYPREPGFSGSLRCIPQSGRGHRRGVPRQREIARQVHRQGETSLPVALRRGREALQTVRCHPGEESVR